MVICGRMIGETSEVDISDLSLNFKHAIGSTMVHLERLVTDGAFSPVASGTYDLPDTTQGFADMAGCERFGKLAIQL